MFRKFALALPGVEEATHFDRPGFRTKKGVFATLKNDGEAMIRVHPASKAQALIAQHPSQFFTYGGFSTGVGSLGVHLKAARSELVKALLRDAWREVAPKPKRITATTVALGQDSGIALPFDPSAFFEGRNVRANVNDKWVNATVVARGKEHWLIFPTIAVGTQVVIAHLVSSGD